MIVSLSVDDVTLPRLSTIGADTFATVWKGFAWVVYTLFTISFVLLDAFLRTRCHSFKASLVLTLSDPDPPDDIDLRICMHRMLATAQQLTNGLSHLVLLRLGDYTHV